MLKLLTMRRAKQLALQAVEAPVSAIKSQYGQLPHAFWEDEYVHGYLMGMALWSIQYGAKRGQIRELNEREQAEVIGSTFGRVDPTNTFMNTVATTDIDEYKRGIMAADKCMDYELFGLTDVWKDDPDILAAQNLAKKDSLFADVGGNLFGLCWNGPIADKFFREKK